MNLSGFGIEAIAHMEPDSFLSSDAIEENLREMYERIKLPFGRIEMQTGIKFRGIFKDKNPSDISIGAANNLFENSNVEKNDIDLLIHASVCRDFLEPSTASVIHHKLGLAPSCQVFDLSNACLGVLNAISLATQMIKAGGVKKALIVTGENATPLITKTIETLTKRVDFNRKDIRKFFANFTIGSAGVALVISNASNNLCDFGNYSILSDTSAHTLCQGSGSMEGLVMETNSEELMQKGVALAKKNWNDFSDKDFDHYLCHQVGVHHQEYLYKELGLDLSKDYSTFERYGNTGSAALPLTLSHAIKDKHFSQGDKIALLGIGSGLHTIMMDMQWN